MNGKKIKSSFLQRKGCPFQPHQGENHSFYFFDGNELKRGEDI